MHGPRALARPLGPLVAALLVVACTVEAEGEDPAEMEDAEEWPGEPPGDADEPRRIPEETTDELDPDGEPTEEEAPELDLEVQAYEDGDHLVDGDGLPVYASTQDGDGESHCVGECLTHWPIVSTAGPDAVEVGDGVDEGLIEILERDDGTPQVTYAGYPLHRYVEDVNDEPDEPLGHGVDDTWSLIAPDGQLLIEDGGT